MAFENLAQLACAAAVCSLVAGCGVVSETRPMSSDLAYSRPSHATTPAAPADDPTLFPDDDSDSGPAMVGGARLQCVPYARAHSSVDIHGDAYTWWEKAAGVYDRSSAPVDGAIMVLKNYAGRHHAHVAVVRRMISPREIRIDHANWLNDGAIYVNDPVLDVSADNDWSLVKVWNIRSGSWGTKVYAVQGFIGPAPAQANPEVASNRGLVVDPIGGLIAASGTTSAYPSAPRIIRSRLDR
jgi:surface antigen